MAGRLEAGGAHQLTQMPGRADRATPGAIAAVSSDLSCRALTAGLGEAGGGVLIALGLATTVAGAAAAGTMIPATAVDAPSGFFATSGGYESENAACRELGQGDARTSAGGLDDRPPTAGAMTAQTTSTHRPTFRRPAPDRRSWAPPSRRFAAPTSRRPHPVLSSRRDGHVAGTQSGEVLGGSADPSPGSRSGTGRQPVDTVVAVRGVEGKYRAHGSPAVDQVPGRSG
jgi:DoxX